MSIKLAVFAVLLTTAAGLDIRKREIPDSLSVMIAIAALIDTAPQHLPGMLLSAVVITLPQFVIALLKPDRYGGADIKIMAACAFLLGLERGLIAIITGLTAGLLVTILLRAIRKTDGAFPVVPYLAAGSLFAYIL